MIKVKINNQVVEVDEGLNIIEAARQAGINVPTLCYLKGLSASGSCRVCMVELVETGKLVPACVYPVTDGLEVLTHSEKVLQTRKTNVELLVSNHSKDCLQCARHSNCEIQVLTNELGIRDDAFKGVHSIPTFVDASEGLVRDTSKCVLCGRCVETCNRVQGLGVLDFMNRGFETKIGPAGDKDFIDANCMQCGQCLINCPTGALSEKEEVHEVIQALQDKDKFVIVQTAPAVRAALGEEFGMPIGTRVTGKMVSALKKIGFDRVYDTNFSADLTIMEEGHEFIDRLSNGGTLPMMTSCSPGWVRYLEYEYSDLIDNLSTCKSPHMMFGAVLKSHFPQVMDIDPKDIYTVSVMPCTAKKAEAKRPEMVNEDGIKDVDAVITTRELATLIKMYGVNFPYLEDDEFDQDMFGEYSGAGVIFGATGGVMEAALRTVVEELTGDELEDVNFKAVRGMDWLKEAELDINGTTVRVAVVHSMKAAKPLLDDIRTGKSPYHFIEVMGCPGGCINGGGQPIISSRTKNQGVDYKKLRAQALYDEDRMQENRKSHKNKQIQKLYRDFFKKPGSSKAHELLHTHYYKRQKYE